MLEGIIMHKQIRQITFIAMICICFAPSAHSAQQGHAAVNGDGKHHWLFPNHPKLRRVTKAVGFGAATGGIIGPILGAGVVGGAAVGAAEHGTVRGIKDHHDMKKHGHLDHHIW
jgi:hypothetical protein